MAAQAQALWQQLQDSTSRETVRIPEKWSFVSPTGRIAHSTEHAPSGGPFRGSPKPDDSWSLFHVVTTGSIEAAVVDAHTVGRSDERARKSMANALAHRYPLVVMLLADAPTAAVARCFASELDAATVARESAFAIWGLKALGGWEESPWMTFALMIKGKAPNDLDAGVELRVFSEWAPRAKVTVRSDSCPWEHFIASVDEECVSHLAVFDVDSMLIFKDAEGFEEGDLVLARIGSAFASVAAAVGARARRVGGDEFAIVAKNEHEALALAEEGRAAVEALALPLSHPSIETRATITVSAAALATHDIGTLRERANDALTEAKRRGRNVVFAATS